MYKFIKLKSNFHVDLKDINEIEKTYDLLFPKVLREFYMYYNGDSIKLCKFTIDDYEYAIAKIVQLKYGTATFEYIVDSDREDEIIDKNMFPIARNEGGDYYYWNAINENVYLYFCDDIENPVYICENIEQLFNLMESGCED